MNSSVLLLSNGNSQNLLELSHFFNKHGWNVLSAETGAEALGQLESETFSALILEPRLPDLETADVIRVARQSCQGIAIFVVDVATRTVSGVNLRSDTLTQHVHSLVRQWAESPHPVAPPVSSASGQAALPGMIGTHPQMKAMYRAARLVARRSTSVLIYGESGTGKELVARALHDLSPRAGAPLVVVNCAAIPETLFESELFGHIRGAFTGAVQSQLGKIHAANNGTLFLDEIGELPLSVQAKLLRFLQEKEVQRLGSTDVFRVDTRVVAATNADLEKLSREGKFREDLYYRISVFPIALAPLRERRDDIALLATHFLQLLAEEDQEPLKRLGPGAQQFLESYSWPGNVRELKHVVERAVIMAEETAVLEPEHFAFLNSEKNFRQNLPLVEPKLHLQGQDADHAPISSRNRQPSGLRQLS